MSFESKILRNRHNNDYGFNIDQRYRQEEGAIWYEGKSENLKRFYTQNLTNLPNPSADFFTANQSYFWKVVAAEPQTKTTHSGLPHAIIDTLISIIGKPEIKVNKKVLNEQTKNYEIVEDLVLTDLLNEILKDNNFQTLMDQDQLPYMLAVGDGAFFINYDKSISDFPMIVFSDGRNIEFEYKENRVVAVKRKIYFVEDNKTYMLEEIRTTTLEEDEKTKTKKRIATIEYNLYELANEKGQVKQHVDLKTTEKTKGLEKTSYECFNQFIAVPTIYKLDKTTGRGKGMFSSKYDLLDDLDQNLSMSSTTTRRSAPVDYLPEELMEYDDEGNRKKFNTFERKVFVYKNDLNSATGVNQAMIETKQPVLNFEQYSSQALEILHNILAGILSPATLGIDLARDNNATAQREKEKVTMITRDDLIDFQTETIEKLCNLLLKVYFNSQGNKAQAKEDYEIFVNYPEYANPSFDSKLAVLAPVFASGAMSAKQYVNELWGDSLTEEEKEEEIKKLEERQSAYNAPDEEPYDLFNIEG